MNEQNHIAVRASAARQVEDMPAAPRGGPFPLTPALSLGERVNRSPRGEQSRRLDSPLRDACCSLSVSRNDAVGKGERDRPGRSVRRLAEQLVSQIPVTVRYA